MGTLRGLGSGYVGRGVLDALLAAADAHRYTFWLPSEWRSEYAGERTRFVDGGVLRKFVFENVSLRRALSDFDALLSLGDTSIVRSRRPHLLYVQQSHLAYRPEDWGYEAPPRFSARMTLMAWYFRAGMPHVTRFAVQSGDMRQHLCERWGIDETRVVVIPSAVTEVDVADAREAPAAEPYLLCPTSAGPHKNLPLLAEILAALPARHRDLKLRVTLPPALAPDLRNRASELGVADRLSFTGSVSRPQFFSLVRGARVCVLPSVLESFGLTYYEVMSQGVPAVASDRGFAREAGGDAMKYAQPHRAEAFAEGIVEFLDSEALAREYGQRGRARYRECTSSWSEVSRRFVAELEALVR